MSSAPFLGSWDVMEAPSVQSGLVYFFWSAQPHSTDFDQSTRVMLPTYKGLFRSFRQLLFRACWFSNAGQINLGRRLLDILHDLELWKSEWPKLSYQAVTIIWLAWPSLTRLKTKKEIFFYCQATRLSGVSVTITCNKWTSLSKMFGKSHERK